MTPIMHDIRFCVVLFCLVAFTMIRCKSQDDRFPISTDKKQGQHNDDIPDKALMDIGKWESAKIANARWISRDSLVWKISGNISDLQRCVYKLYWHPTGDIWVGAHGVELGQGGAVYALPFSGVVGDGNDTERDRQLPYLSYLKGRIRISTASISDIIDDIVKGHLILAMEDEHGRLLAATGIQLAGVLDDCYAYRRELGLNFTLQNQAIFKLWAPTATAVKIHIYRAATGEEEISGSPFSMTQWKEQGKWTGVWQYTASPDCHNCFYLYEVQVFVRRLKKLATNIVTDPYSVSLSANSKRSQIVDLRDMPLKPADWDSHARPELAHVMDIVIYELHVRDFSMYDPIVPTEHRGSFLAFTHFDSYGMKHLAALAASGLTHIHLLPVFDVATIEEERSRQKAPDIQQDAAADSPVQQAIVEKVKDEDGFNWGYDPFHYMVPEGSYATVPEGSHRILEFRAMVRAIHEIGLRVIMDVVFNHTYCAGQDATSVLDKIVPDYYYRLDDDGNLQCSSCCPDTASEHVMMEKLMIDSLLHWAVHYQIDGFRFDLMGHHTKANMHNIRRALDSLVLDKHGVDGRKIYVYGEAWKFGSLQAILPDQACHQANTYGLGIGSFNDRLRDSVRGGSPFAELPAQGFVNGLYYDFNKAPQNREATDDLEAQKAMLLNYMDNICIGMAGNLKDYEFTSYTGNLVHGCDIRYRGAVGAGYTASPQETINYVSVHDNHTLWDCLQAKAPFRTPGRNPNTATVEERVRMQNLAISIVALGQGIPLFHAGVDMLRSKSGDTDSYNSGDWFNRLDFTYRSNNWGAGLPLAEKNQKDWEFWRARLADSTIKPDSSHIQKAVAHFQEMLAIRKSSPLFRLHTAQDIVQRVRFINQARHKPGLIVMTISDKIPEQGDLDPQIRMILIAVNATPETMRFGDDSLCGINLVLHPILQHSQDTVVRQSYFDKNVLRQLPKNNIPTCLPFYPPASLLLSYRATAMCLRRALLVNKIAAQFGILFPSSCLIIPPRTTVVYLEPQSK